MFPRKAATFRQSEISADGQPNSRQRRRLGRHGSTIIIGASLALAATACEGTLQGLEAGSLPAGAENITVQLPEAAGGGQVEVSTGENGIVVTPVVEGAEQAADTGDDMGTMDNDYTDDGAMDDGGDKHANHDHGSKAEVKGTGNGNRQYEKEGIPHNFMEHVQMMLGDDVLAPGQQMYSGVEKVGEGQYVARSAITALRPIIEQAIDDVKDRKKKLTGDKLESEIAQELTQLNDWNDLDDDTQEAIMLLTGYDFDSMSRKEREMTISHLQHSPLPFGDLDTVLYPGDEIDFGYTHTLDKNKTRVEDLGNGLFQVWMISNNNNGSHTGHVLGSFKVQLDPGTKVNKATDIVNDIVKNKNNNNRLYLDDAAKAILYGDTPRLDLSGMSKDSYKGNTDVSYGY